jgi:hypothetical protein
MEIDKTSWHYFLADFAHTGSLCRYIDRGNVNSCEYRTLIIKGTAAVLFVAMFGGLFLLVCLAAFINLFATPIALMMGVENNTVLELSIPLCFLSWIGILVFAATKLSDHIQEKRKPTIHLPKPPSIIRQFIAAYKAKYCPIISMKD